MSERTPVDAERLGLIARETMTGDVRDLIMNAIKNLKPGIMYSALPASDQRELMEAATERGKQMIEDVVALVAADGRQTHRLSMKQVGTNAQGDIVVKMTCPYDQTIWDALGPAKAVEVAVSDSKPFQGERRPGFKHVDEEQKSLIPDDDAPDEKPVMDQTDVGKKAAPAPKPAPASRTEPPAMNGKGLARPSGELTADGFIALGRVIVTEMKTYRRPFEAAFGSVIDTLDPWKGFNADFEIDIRQAFTFARDEVEVAEQEYGIERHVTLSYDQDEAGDPEQTDASMDFTAPPSKPKGKPGRPRGSGKKGRDDDAAGDTDSAFGG